MITWDIETKGLAGDLVIGGIYNNSLYCEFENFEDFIFLLKNVFESDDIYAHNGGKYDNRYLLEFFRDRKIEITNILYINNGLIFNAKIGKNLYKFRDSIHLLPRSLDSLSKSFNVKHKKQSDFNMKKWLNDGYKITDELRYYLKMDCISLYEILKTFNTTFDIKPGLTIASTAFKELLSSNYKNISLKNLCVNTLSKLKEEWIRKAYKGGRVEVFEKLVKNFYKYDVNSLYPSAMKTKDYPFGKYFECNQEESEKALAQGKLGICECEIKVKNMEIPYLGFRYDEKLIFPVGSWRDTITSLEVIEARKRGYEIKIIKSIFWTNKGKIFYNFVDKYYKIKETSKEAKKEIAKLFLNSPYGKFAQKRTHRAIKSELEIIKSGTNIDDIQSFDNGFMFSKEETSYKNRSINPIYAIFVTAYARHILYEGFEAIINNGGNIYYCDTDCICSDIELPFKMQHKTELGKWDFEGFYDVGVFIAPKLYAIKNDNELIVRGKGINREKLEKCTIDDFFDVVINENELEFSVERVTGVFEHFRRKDTDKNKYIGLINQTKKVSGKYTKRQLLSKSSTKALEINLI